MKLRIQGNSLRFRLNRREVQAFETAGKVACAIDFPDGRGLQYCIETCGGAAVDASLEGASIKISVPERVARDWAGSERVDIRHSCSLEGGGTLDILIEKDFQCLHKGEEGKDPDAYPNPMAG